MTKSNYDNLTTTLDFLFTDTIQYLREKEDSIIFTSDQNVKLSELLKCCQFLEKVSFSMSYEIDEYFKNAEDSLSQYRNPDKFQHLINVIPQVAKKTENIQSKANDMEIPF